MLCKKKYALFFSVIFLGSLLFCPILVSAQNQAQITRITITNLNADYPFHRISIEGQGISFTGAGDGFVPNIWSQCRWQGCLPMMQIDLGLDPTRTYMHYYGKGSFNETSFRHFSNFANPGTYVIKITSPPIVFLRTIYRRQNSVVITQPANIKARLFGYVTSSEYSDPPLFDKVVDMNGTVTAEFDQYAPWEYAFFPSYQLRKVTYTFTSE